MGKVLKRDLNNLKFYIAEKERLLKEIEKYSDQIDCGYKSLSYDEVYAKSVNKDATINLVIHNERVMKILKKREKSLSVIIIKLENIIKKIENPEVRGIVELRAVYGKTWEQIGEEMHMERTTVAKKYKVFIDN